MAEARRPSSVRRYPSKILILYLMREVTETFLALFVLLLLIYTSSWLVKFLAEAAAGRLSSDLLLRLLGLKLFTSLVVMLPLCLFLAIYFGYSRLYRDNEITAIRNMGLNTRFFLGHALAFGFIFLLLIAYLSLSIAPQVEQSLDVLQTKAKVESDITGIAAGRFKEFNEGDRILYAEKISDDRQKLENIFLRLRDDKKQAVLTASSAHLEKHAKDERFVVFSKGVRYSGKPGHLDYHIAEYERYGLRLDLNDHNGSDQRPLRATPTDSLWNNVETPAISELQWRLSMPLSAFFLAPLAASLALALPYYGRYSGLITAVLLYFLYSNLLGIARSLLKKGTLPPWPGMWWVHALVLLIILLILFTPVVRRWLRRPARQRVTV